MFVFYAGGSDLTCLYADVWKLLSEFRDLVDFVGGGVGNLRHYRIEPFESHRRLLIFL